MRPTSTTVASTGEPREPLMPSRTRVAADHAGPSLPTLPSSSVTGKPLVSSQTSPSSSSLTVIQPPTDALVDGTSGLGTISRATLSTLRPSTHIRLKPAHVLLRTLVAESSATLVEFSRLPLPIRLLSRRVLSPLPLLLVTTFSSYIEVVSSPLPPTAQPASTTPSPLSDGEALAARTTGSSETPGVVAGVTRVTSSSLPLMARVFAAPSSTLTLLPPTECSQYIKNSETKRYTMPKTRKIKITFLYI